MVVRKYGVVAIDSNQSSYTAVQYSLEVELTIKKGHAVKGYVKSRSYDIGYTSTFKSLGYNDTPNRIQAELDTRGIDFDVKAFEATITDSVIDSFNNGIIKSF